MTRSAAADDNRINDLQPPDKLLGLAPEIVAWAYGDAAARWGRTLVIPISPRKPAGSALRLVMGLDVPFDKIKRKGHFST